jgi:hypothetical protein
MLLELYTKENIGNLTDIRVAKLLDDYFREVHRDNYHQPTPNEMLDILHNMVISGKSLYLLLDKGIPVGFLIVFINDQYGLTDPVVYVDYMYIDPESRNGKAVLMMYTMVGMICDDTGYEAYGCTFTSSSNIGNNQLVGGEVVAKVTQFPMDKIKSKLEKYKKRLKYEN